MADQNVIQMPEPMIKLADRIRAAWRRTEYGRQEWIEGTLDLAAALAEARARFPGNMAFSVWLAENELDMLGKDDRAVLIAMAADLATARAVLEESKRASWQLIWREEIEPRLLSAKKTAEQAPVCAGSDATAPTTPIAPDPAIPEAAEKQGPAKARRSYGTLGSGGGLIKDASKADLVRLLGVAPEDYTTLFSAYPLNRQRALKAALIGLAKQKARKKKVGDLFRLAVSVVVAGKAPDLTNAHAFSPLIFLPDVPEAFCFSFNPTMLADRFDRLAALNTKAVELRAAAEDAFNTHEQLRHLWEHGAELPPQAPAPVVVAPDDSKARIKHDVKYCGVVIWPSERLKHVTFEDMNTGWHLVDHWLKHLEVATPKKPNEVLQAVGHLINDIAAASTIKGLTDVMTACMSAYAKKNARQGKADFSDGMAPGRAR